jgi:hypothetical protein
MLPLLFFSKQYKNTGKQKSTFIKYDKDAEFTFYKRDKESSDFIFILKQKDSKNNKKN